MADEVVTTPIAANTSLTPADGAANAKTTPQTAQNDQKTGATGTAKPAEPELIERKVNGKSVKKTRDEWDTYSSLGLTATERMQEAAEMKRKADATLSRIKDPEKLLEFLEDPENKFTPEQVRAALDKFYLTRYIEPSKRTPEQNELEAAKARIKKFEEKEAAEKRQKDEAEESERETKLTTDLIEEIKAICDSTDLEKNSFTAKRVAYWVRINELNGLNAPRELVVEQVKKESAQNLRESTKGLKGKALVERLGKEIVDEIRRYDTEQLRARRTKLQPNQEPKKETQPRNSEEDTPRAAGMRSIWSKW